MQPYFGARTKRQISLEKQTIAIIIYTPHFFFLYIRYNSWTTQILINSIYFEMKEHLFYGKDFFHEYNSIYNAIVLKIT